MMDYEAAKSKCGAIRDAIQAGDAGTIRRLMGEVASSLAPNDFHNLFSRPERDAIRLAVAPGLDFCPTCERFPCSCAPEAR